MAKIYDSNGTYIGDLPISEQDQAKLDAGGVALSFHTPRMLRETMGVNNFTVFLSADANGKVVADSPEQVKRAIAHLAAVAERTNG